MPAAEVQTPLQPDTQLCATKPTTTPETVNQFGMRRVARSYSAAKRTTIANKPLKRRACVPVTACRSLPVRFLKNPTLSFGLAGRGNLEPPRMFRRSAGGEDPGPLGSRQGRLPHQHQGGTREDRRS